MPDQLLRFDLMLLPNKLEELIGHELFINSSDSLNQIIPYYIVIKRD